MYGPVRGEVARASGLHVSWAGRLVAGTAETACEESHGQGPLAPSSLLLKIMSSKSDCHPHQVPGVLPP